MGVVNSFVNNDVVGEETQLEVGEGISPSQEEKSLERAMGFEPKTSCLVSKHSTPELRPLGASDCTILEAKYPQMLVHWDLSTLTRNGVAHFAWKNGHVPSVQHPFNELPNGSGHAYLCSWGNPPEGSLGIPMCPKPLESWEIPHELEGNKSRGTA